MFLEKLSSFLWRVVVLLECLGELSRFLRRVPFCLEKLEWSCRSIRVLIGVLHCSWEKHRVLLKDYSVLREAN